MQVCAFLLNYRRLCRVLQNVTCFFFRLCAPFAVALWLNFSCLRSSLSVRQAHRLVGTPLPCLVGLFFKNLQQTNEIEQQNQENGNLVSYSYPTQQNLTGPNADDMEIRTKETRYRRPIQSLFSRFFLCSPLSLKY